MCAHRYPASPASPLLAPPLPRSALCDLKQHLTHSLGLTTAYPLFASYWAYTDYTSIATKAGASTLHVGGVAIPVGTMLRRAAAQKDTVEDDTLSFQLLKLHMWFVYWLVTACIDVVEELFFVKALPMFSVARLALSAWLMSPIARFSALRDRATLLTFAESQAQWDAFSRDGCGLVFFQYIVPFLEQQIDAFSLSWLRVRSSFSVLTVCDLVSDASIAMGTQSAATSLVPSFTLNAAKLPEGYIAGWTGLVGSILPLLFDAKTATPKGLSSPTSEKDLFEYAVVDKPADEQQQKSRAESSPKKDRKQQAATRRFRIW